MNRKTVGWALVIAGALVVLWQATRTFPVLAIVLPAMAAGLVGALLVIGARERQELEDLEPGMRHASKYRVDVIIPASPELAGELEYQLADVGIDNDLVVQIDVEHTELTASFTTWATSTAAAERFAARRIDRTGLIPELIRAARQ